MNKQFLITLSYILIAVKLCNFLIERTSKAPKGHEKIPMSFQKAILSVTESCLPYQ